MVFQSIEYLIFLPVVFILYWILGKRSKTIQNIIIVISSVIFYGWADWRFLGLLLFTALTTFFAGKLIQVTTSHLKRKFALVTTIILNIGILLFFKYYNFFVDAFTDAFLLFGVSITPATLKLILPIGISFYTFTALSYSIDVYQGKIKSTNDIVAYLAYVMFFPSILSGPISRAQTQLPQYFDKRIFNYDMAVSACKLLVMGGVMKLCLADRLGIYVDTVYANIALHNGTTLLIASILYSIQIYADFAGYSLMAIGSGKLLGIELQTNFIRPYFAKTVTDFWRRWHISLTTWFRDYIYFPLGGNRCSKSRWILNTMIVFVVSGLWHGAAYTFLIWGALHGACMVVERVIYGEKIKHIPSGFNIANLFRLLLTFVVVNFIWIFFRINNLYDVIFVFSKIFTEPGLPFIDLNTLSLAFVSMVIVLAYDFLQEKNLNLMLLDSKYLLVRYATIVFLICFILSFGVLNGGSFIYFQF